MADQTLVIDGNLSPLVQKVNQARGAIKGMVKDAAGLGESFSGALVKVDLLMRAVRTASSIITAADSKARGAAASRGERSVALTTSLGSLGIKDTENASTRLLNQQGNATIDQRVAFAGSLSGVNKSRQAPLSAKQAEEAMQAYAALGDTGLGAGGSELIEGLGQGLGTSEIVSNSLKKRGGLLDPNSPAAKYLRQKAREDVATLEEEDIQGAAGDQIAAQDVGFRRMRNREEMRGTVGARIRSLTPDAIRRVTEGGLGTDAAGDSSLSGQRGSSTSDEAVAVNKEILRTLKVNATRPTFATNPEVK